MSWLKDALPTVAVPVWHVAKRYLAPALLGGLVALVGLGPVVQACSRLLLSNAPGTSSEVLSAPMDTPSPSSPR